MRLRSENDPHNAFQMVVLYSTVVKAGGREQGRGEAGRTRTATWAAWIICALSLGLATIDLVLVSLNSSHPDVRIPEPWLAHTVSAVAFSTVGAMVGSRRPDNPIGWLFCAIGVFSPLLSCLAASMAPTRY